MRHWIFAFGPDGDKIIKQAELMALRLRKGNGIISVNGPDVHVDNLPKNSVQIMRFYDWQEALFSFSEEHLEEVTIDFYDSVPTEGCAVIGRDLVLTLPEEVTYDKVKKLIIRREPDDTVTRYIRWSVEMYYPTLTARKLSGKKFT